MKLVIVCSLKGGTGKTTTTINTARALVRSGYKVGILDLDYRTPNVPIALDDGVAQLDHTYEGDVLLPPTIENIKVMSMAYIWPEWKCVMVEDSQAMEDVLHLLTPEIVDWGKLDYLVIDTPPSAVGVVKVALEAENILGALIVSHASRVSRMDTIRTIDLFAEKQVPIIGLICNQGVDENGTPRHDLTPDDIRDVASEYEIPFIESIPHTNDQSVLDSYFDIVANAVVSTRPVTLKIKEPSDEAWTRLISMSKKLLGKMSS